MGIFAWILYKISGLLSIQDSIEIHQKQTFVFTLSEICVHFCVETVQWTWDQILKEEHPQSTRWAPTILVSRGPQLQVSSMGGEMCHPSVTHICSGHEKFSGLPWRPSIVFWIGLQGAHLENFSGFALQNRSLNDRSLRC